MFYNKIKTLVPQNLKAFIRNPLLNTKLKRAYRYDYQKYLKFGRNRFESSPVKLIGQIILLYHVIEKGLTMPETRLGFGKQRIIRLCDLCLKYRDKYGLDDDQVTHAIQVILEYNDFHKRNNFKLDKSVIECIDHILDFANQIEPSQQIEVTREDYFKHTFDSFQLFSNSRSSIRNFTQQNIPIEELEQGLELARNTPSACNRQSWRTYIFSDHERIKRILDAQGGNNGFGHLTNKLIVITGEMGLFGGIAERYQVYIDGGMYAMNLLYALHYNQIAACILNCSHTPEKDELLRNICGIKDSENFIAMIACGIPPERFKIAISRRYERSDTNNIID
ncbi:MAG TPA: nitroreductase family protein [Nitrosomonas sp.]|nr:nitroreductase family protein [Nitrosomonas sp.]